MNATKWLAVILTCAMLATSCDQGTPVSTTRGSAKVECDESVFPVMQFQAGDFHSMYPEGTITLRSVEAREAVVDFLNDSVRVIALARPFNPEELDYIKKANIDYEGYKIALDAIAVIINRQQPDSLLRMGEVDSIFSSTLTRWKRWKNRPIDAYVGDINSSGDEIFRTVILNGRPLGPTVTRMKSSKSIVGEVAKNPNAVGLVGLSWLHGREGEVMVCRLGGGTYRPVMRVRAAIEGTKENIQQILITDIPFQLDRSSFIVRLRELIQNQTLSNVADVRDESEGNRIRIILPLKPHVDANEVLSTLDRQTQVVDTTLVAGQFFSPAQAHVLRKYYPIWREVYMYTREPRRDVSYGFIAYVKDRKGQQNFINHGLVPAAQPVRIVETTSEKVQ